MAVRTPLTPAPMTATRTPPFVSFVMLGPSLKGWSYSPPRLRGIGLQLEDADLPRPHVEVGPRPELQLAGADARELHLQALGAVADLELGPRDRPEVGELGHPHRHRVGLAVGHHLDVLG